MVPHFEPVAANCSRRVGGYYKIRHRQRGEFLYTGSRMLDDDRRHALTWMGKDNGDPAMVWHVRGPGDEDDGLGKTALEWCLSRVVRDDSRLTLAFLERHPELRGDACGGGTPESAAGAQD